MHVKPVLLSMLVAATALAQAPSKKPLLPFKATEKTLPNGLKVIVVPTGFPNLVSTQISVQTGSRNEVEPGKSGFAHFFEHMMFRGTKTVSPAQFQAAMTKAGARTNAYTTSDYTNYHATFAKEDLEDILRIEGDRFQNLDYDLEGFKTESRAVLGEYNKNSANPFSKLYEVQRDHAFTTHPYKHTTMGFLKDIEDMPNQFEYAHEFFGRWYRPEYTTVIIAGDVVPDKVLPLVTKYFGSWKKGSFKASIPQEPKSTAKVYSHVPWETATLPLVSVGFHGPKFSETDKDFAALDMLFDLHFGDTSELHKRLVEDEQIVDMMSPQVSVTADPELFTVIARLKNAADAVKVRDAILKEFQLARTELIDAQRLSDARLNSRNGVLRTLDNTTSIAAMLASFARVRRSFDTLNNFYSLYAGLTPNDLLTVAKKYLVDSSLVVTTLSKEALPEGIATAPELASLDRKAVSATPVSATPALPLLQQRTALPLINVQISFNSGSAQDPEGKEGLAFLTARMISEGGSKAMTFDQITKALFPIAGSFNSSIDKEVTRFTGIVPSEGWERFADIDLPRLIEPGFREDDFQRLKAQVTTNLVTDLRSNNEEELGKERLSTSLFAKTPYGHPVQGTVAGLKAITLDDVKAFAAKHYTRANVVLGLAGGAPESAVTRLQSELGRLPAGATKPPATVAPVARKPKGLEIELVKKETRATAISFGFPIEVTRSHPDFAALNLVRAYLGEHRSSMARLYERIREVRGMNYGDYAYIEAFPRGGGSFFPPTGVPRLAQIFEVWIRPVAPENAHFALRIALHELDVVISNGLSQADFEATRDYLMKNVYVVTATQDQQLGYALDERFYGLGDYATTMREALAKLTLADVNAAIRKHLTTKDLAVVMIVKDADGLKKKLVADELSTIKYDATKPPELLEEDKKIGARKLSIKAEAVKITPVEEVFAK